MNYERYFKSVENKAIIYGSLALAFMNMVAGGIMWYKNDMPGMEITTIGTAAAILAHILHADMELSW